MSKTQRLGLGLLIMSCHGMMESAGTNWAFGFSLLAMVSFNLLVGW